MTMTDPPLDEAPSRVTMFWVRGAFIGIILLAPLYYMFARYGVETWPTFSLPRFAGSVSAPQHFALKQITAVKSDGERVDLAWDDLVKLPGGVSTAVQSLNFSPNARPAQFSGLEKKVARVFSYYPFDNYWDPRIGVPHGNDPDTRDFLKDQLRKIYPDESFDRIEFVWYGFDGYIRSTEIPSNAVTDTYVVQLP
jgi:hypothetical protein